MVLQDKASLSSLSSSFGCRRHFVDTACACDGASMIPTDQVYLGAHLIRLPKYEKLTKTNCLHFTHSRPKMTAAKQLNNDEVNRNSKPEEERGRDQRILHKLSSGLLLRLAFRYICLVSILYLLLFAKTSKIELKKFVLD